MSGVAKSFGQLFKIFIKIIVKKFAQLKKKRYLCTRLS